MYAATSASNAAASIRRAPSRTISSINDPPSTGPAGASSLLVTTVSTGVPFRPALARGPYSIPGLRTRREGTPPDLIHRFRALLAEKAGADVRLRKVSELAQVGIDSNPAMAANAAATADISTNQCQMIIR